MTASTPAAGLPSFAAIAAAIASEDAARAKLRAALQSNAALLATARALYAVAAEAAKALGVPGVDLARTAIDIVIAEAEAEVKSV